jgi:hypothetical protein
VFCLQNTRQFAQKKERREEALANCGFRVPDGPPKRKDRVKLCLFFLNRLNGSNPENFTARENSLGSSLKQPSKTDRFCELRVQSPQGVKKTEQRSVFFEWFSVRIFDKFLLAVLKQ